MVSNYALSVCNLISLQVMTKKAKTQTVSLNTEVIFGHYKVSA